jgi:peptidyl-prolyl cis-trans isomerase SurA
VAQQLSYSFDHMRNFAFPLGMVACAMALVSCNKSVSPDVAAMVNSRPITYSDVDKAFLLQSAGAQDRPQNEQMSIQKLEILRSLVDTEIMLQRAEKLSLMATDSDVETKFAELKSPYTAEEFQRQLSMRKMSALDLRAQIRRDLSVQKLINKEITSHINVTEQDVTGFYTANRNSFNLPEAQIHLAQIVVTPGPDSSVRNLKSDNATTEEAAKTKIQTIEARLRQGEDFAAVAQNFSEDPNSAPNGGDLGFVPESALEKADPELRRMLSQLSAGQVSRVIRMPGEYRILKVISKEPAGQRELNDPRVQQSIRETLINGKDGLLRAAYYEVARNEAKVVNYYAQSVVTNKGAKK